MAATSSSRQKHQWRPSRGASQSTAVTDLAVNSSSSSNQDPLSASAHRSINDSAQFRSSSSSAADMRSDKNGFFVPTLSCSSSATPPSSLSAVNKKSSFIPYLPHDDAVAAGLGADQGAIDAVETQQVADILNQELGRLLKMQPPEFWKAVTLDNSIEVSLDSYLQFRRRWYDSHAKDFDKPLAGVIVGDQELLRRVFMVLYRMSLSAESGVQPTGVTLPDECRVDLSSNSNFTKVLYQKQIFDIPKLLDICAIYGNENANLTRELVYNVFAINENLYNDLADIVPVISNTVHAMQQRCSATLVMRPPTENSEMSVVSKIQKELLEVLDYLNDAVTSLYGFVDAHPEGVVVLVLGGNNSDSKDQILFTLAAMHDSLIPTVCRSFSRLQRSFAHNYLDSAAETRSSRLRMILIDLVWRLFCFSYLKEDNKADSQNGFVNHLLKTYICNPRARGEGLIQVLTGMVEEPSRSFLEDVISSGALIRNIDRKHRLLERVNQLHKEGLISLDNVQYDYAEAIIAYSNAGISASLPNRSSLPPSTQELSEDDVLNESKISHIKDILPDYGIGFIAACLEAYDNNPEEVIQRILEGTLHLSLQSLDTTLAVKPVSLTASVPVKDKGKGKVDEAPPRQKGASSISAETQVKSRWQDDGNGLEQRRSSSKSASSSSINEESRRPFSKQSDEEPAKTSMQGRFVRKEKGEENAELLFNERLPDDVRRTAAYAAQYEDEYDDSFDELGTHIADGVEETEILVDLTRSKSSVGIERRFHQANKSFTGSRSDGMRKGAWAVNNVVPHEGKGASVREHNNNVGETQRKLQPQISRGRGRGRRDGPRAQFYVKDGMNYSYKVGGSVAVASAEDADALRKVERDTIHGLGQGGNVPVSNDQATDPGNAVRGSRHMSSRSNHGEPAGRSGGPQGRGRGFPRKEHDAHHRKDRAMQKHFAGLGGM